MSTHDQEPAATAPMTPEQENAFYADPHNQTPQGPPVRRRRGGTAKLSDPVPVRFPEDLLEQVRQRAAADDRSLSNWIRRAVEHELTRPGA
ncbi:ribbon-helix-helix domain-containing protein [uncultured Pseudokineococcus sp.]|uniref:ribbon-helix-helix domain-containing protein n=1 Tax=uncultured Pseudokineococcus sp. TaxID=1642928 RepID=UPI00260A0776|nr:ribbon-helix-helix domain-containing protein [uncultured Pseudokineococcus sp.]